MTGPRVAIIDDDKALCLSLVDLMRSAGYRAEPFFEAETLLKSPNRARFECVVADIRMPGMSGFDLVRELRQQGDGTPAILITASHEGTLDHEAISAGAQHLLRKPLETKALLDCIERSLSSDCS
jgi:FixJ family two-component response regulator